MAYPITFNRYRPPTLVRLQNYFLTRLQKSRQENIEYLTEKCTGIKVFNMVLAFFDTEISEIQKMKIIAPAFDCAIQAKDEYLMQILHKRLKSINCKFSFLEYCCRNSKKWSRAECLLEHFKFDDHKPYQLARAARAIRVKNFFGTTTLFSKLNDNLTSHFVRQQKKKMLYFQPWSFEEKQRWFPALHFDLLKSMNPIYPLTMKMLLLYHEDSVDFLSFVRELNRRHNLSPFETDDIHFALENCFTLLEDQMETFEKRFTDPKRSGFAEACYYLLLLVDPKINFLSLLNGDGNSLIFHVFCAKSNKKTTATELAKICRKNSKQQCLEIVLQATDLLKVLLRREDCERKSEILEYLTNEQLVQLNFM